MTTSDATTTVAELKKLIADFVAERDWSQFHSPKNVSMAVAIEARRRATSPMIRKSWPRSARS
jgi:hypothetical protein